MAGLTLSELASDPFVQTGVLAVIGALVTRILLRRYPAGVSFPTRLLAALTALLYHPTHPPTARAGGTPT